MQMDFKNNYKQIKRRYRYYMNLINPFELRKRNDLKNKIRKTIGELSYNSIFDKDRSDWQRLFLEMIGNAKINTVHVDLLFKGFALEKLILVKEAETKADVSAPIVICTQKDNYIYLKEFLPYYRRLGVKHFIFIDNGSHDASFHYLEEQKDVTLYKAPYKFIGTKKAGWKLQALARNGLNKWYLWLDSDEFLAYPDMEKYSLDKYIKILSQKNIINVGGFMLDMYPEYNLFEESENPEKFYEDYIYFDPDSKYYKFANDSLNGGMRGRTLNLYLKLDKTPLIFCTANNIPSGNHSTFPLRKNLRDNYGCVLKHYKFLSGDKEKYQAIAKSDSGYSSTKSLKKYLNLTNVVIKDANSVKFVDSNSLSVFPYVKNFIKM